AGMGTSGLVGQVSTFSVMGNEAWVGIMSLHFVIPALISSGVSTYLRKKGKIKHGDYYLK
ncbi:MAG: PTS sugar transporter subunit IIC, partial [Culicoidibacterales bacterium]